MKNRMTIYTHTNPAPTTREPVELHERMPGFGIVRFDKDKRTITMECWPRMTDPTDPASRQYPGWPHTIRDADNDGREVTGYLPEFVLDDVVDPVVELIDEQQGEIIYMVRTSGRRVRPKVYWDGVYTIRIHDSKTGKRIEKTGLKPTK